MYPYFYSWGAWGLEKSMNMWWSLCWGRIGTQQSDSRVHHDLETLILLLTAKDLYVLLNLVQTLF